MNERETVATKEDAQYLEAGLNCAVRLRRIRDKGTADLMQYEHYNIAMADEIERLRTENVRLCHKIIALEDGIGE